MRPQRSRWTFSYTELFVQNRIDDGGPFALFEMVFTGLCTAEDETTINILQFSDPYNLDVDLHSSRLFSLLNGKSIRSNLIPDL